METDCKLYEKLCKTYKIPLDDRVSTAISGSSSTGELSLTGTSLTSQTCEVIGKLLQQSKVILKLDFSDCLLPHQGLSAILNAVPTSKVHSLQLKGNNINASTTTVLSRMISRSNQIKMLGLEWNNIGVCSDAMEEFCNAISKNSCIEVLDLRNNQCDAECALLIGNALKINVVLRALDIRWNCIGQEGAQHLLVAMQDNKTLTSLKVAGNSVPVGLVTALELATKHNLSLYQVRSECDARTQLLAKHVRVISEQRAQELKQWTERSQQSLRETERRLLELETMNATKQSRIETLEKERSTTEMVKVRLVEVESELKEKQRVYNEARKEIEEYAKELEKMKDEHKTNIAKVQTTLNKEREKETQRADEAEHHLHRATQEIMSLKGDLEALQINHEDNLEAERKLCREKLQRAEKNFESRLSDAANEASREVQSLKDKIVSLESNVESLHRSKCELNTQLLNERAKWKEEKCVVLSEAKEKEEYKFTMLNEKLEYAKEDKLALEGQLAAANATTAQLHRDYAAMLAEVGDVNRKLSHTQEDLAAERLVTQRLRLEKTEDSRNLETVKCDSEKLRNELLFLERKMSEMNESHDKNMQHVKSEMEKIQVKLEAKEKEILAVRAEEAHRAGLLFSRSTNILENCL